MGSCCVAGVTAAEPANATAVDCITIIPLRTNTVFPMKSVKVHGESFHISEINCLVMTTKLTLSPNYFLNTGTYFVDAAKIQY